MAKRFTDTDKWKKPWFSDLSTQDKIIWIYILDDCDHRGVWVSNFKRMSFDLGFEVTQRYFESVFGDKICAYESDKYFLPTFVNFQYGELVESNKVHKPIIKLLENLGPIKVLGSSIYRAQDKAKDQSKAKAMDKSKDQNKEIVPVESLSTNEMPLLVQFWNKHCGNLAKVRTNNPSRNKKIKSIFNQLPEYEWITVIQKLAESDFCNGKSDKGWKADFDFLIKPDTYTKVLEGRYDNHAGKTSTHVSRTYDALDELEAKLNLGEKKCKLI